MASVADEEISEDRRLALMLLARFYLARNLERDSNGKTKKPPGQAKWFKELHAGRWSQNEKFVIAKKSFDNFLRTASPKSCEYIFEFLEPRMTDKSYYAAAPKPVKKAIEVAFKFDPEPQPHRAGNALSETISKITEESQPFAKRLLEKYIGVWDVIRYSAHGHQDYWPSRDPKVMRAVMEIVPPKTEDSAAEFEIRYRAHGMKKSNVCKGSILVLGRGEHFLFLGWESPTKYPIEIFALPGVQSDEGPSLFFGLVVRRHEYGTVFASRVMFVRSAARSLDAGSLKIGMYLRSKLLTVMKRENKQLEDFENSLEIIVNKVGSGGRSGLWLTNTPHAIEQIERRPKGKRQASRRPPVARARKRSLR